MLKKLFSRKGAGERTIYNSEYARYVSRQSLRDAYSTLQSYKRGLSPHDVETRRRKYGENIVVHEERTNPMKLFVSAFINPFIGVLTVLVLISFVLDVLLAEPGEQDWTTIIIITTMVILSALLRFVQELKANRSSDALLKMVTNTCYVERVNGASGEILVEKLVPGDVVLVKYINADGSEDTTRRILRHAFFNSYFSTGLKNLMDKAIVEHAQYQRGLFHLRHHGLLYQ